MGTWQHKEFEKCLTKVTYTNKIQQFDFKESGKYPIISQNTEFISGYWDNDKDVFKLSKPVVIFGDHTRCLKYIDFDFVLGADGVKILQTIDEILPKYLYYYLQYIPIDNLGYSRHYKLLKEKIIKYPTIEQQQKIVEILDKADEIRAKKKLANDKLDEFLKSTFISMFGDVNINPHNFKKITLNDVAKEIFAGGDKPADNCKMKDDIYKYPVYSNGDKNDGLLCYSKTFRVDNLAITVSARGSIGFCKIRQPYFTPVVRLITMIPNEEISIIYLKHFIDNISFTTTGSSQVQLTVPEFKKKYILVPPIELQNKFAQIVEKIEVQKQKNELVIEQMDNLFNSLSQRAFKGEL